MLTLKVFSEILEGKNEGQGHKLTFMCLDNISVIPYFLLCVSKGCNLLLICFLKYIFFLIDGAEKGFHIIVSPSQWPQLIQVYNVILILKVRS